MISKINIKNFDLTKMTDASYMFANCKSLKEIALKNDETQSIPIDIKSIFSGDYSLKEINLKNFGKKIIIKIDFAFNNCKSLETIEIYQNLIQAK